MTVISGTGASPPSSPSSPIPARLRAFRPPNSCTALAAPFSLTSSGADAVLAMLFRPAGSPDWEERFKRCASFPAKLLVPWTTLLQLTGACHLQRRTSCFSPWGVGADSHWESPDSGTESASFSADRWSCLLKGRRRLGSGEAFPWRDGFRVESPSPPTSKRSFCTGAVARGTLIDNPPGFFFSNSLWRSI
eukprot:CAMPEP_0204365546 /NCGR_PEP_ID=MMETSP0469-20131031/41988_1 /ASSEMBLY_ACC=CAM_ASM_000384 /TAXON_ID=2969 /ORGANISM="Oxyrrhis marina" /LENGTH=190 /DNA_ID=CAMNT_0051354619 /DNA_START=187 /DNA_END=756 /DNA_ORIENTATION=+